MKMRNRSQKLEHQVNDLPLGSGQAIPFPLSKGIISFSALLLLILTILSGSALLSSPIHPIGLILGILIPAYLFLIFAIIRRHSLFSGMLFFLQRQLSRFQNQNSDTESTQNKIPAFTPDPRALQLLTKLVMHSAWLIIFVGLLISLFFQFTLKQYQFNLYSTLFPYDSGLYQQIIHLFNYLPSFIFGELISERLIISSLKGAPGLLENAQWARWILLMIALYGLFPRVLFMLWALRNYRHYQALCTKQMSRNDRDFTIIDRAQEQPKSERSPKLITTGSGIMTIALDVAYHLPQEVTIINDRNSFTNLKERLSKQPLEVLTIYIDASLTPDRSLLRRLYTLLNLSMANTIILVESDAHLRTDEWQQKIMPNLFKHEQLLTKSLEELQLR